MPDYQQNLAFQLSLIIFRYYIQLQIQKMNSQMNSADDQSLKIIFSNLNCEIKLSDSALFAFVIRIGKTSSKYTQKKQITNGILKFDSVLELPINGSLPSQQNLKKEKCEIMLYKFRFNREKQSKELIGMASVTVTSEIFQGESKKLRLTNSFDKEALFQCKMRIQLGQADILSSHVSQLSSFHLRSEDQSINYEITGSRAKQNTVTSPTKNLAKMGLITSNSRKSLGQASSEKIKDYNSILNLLIRTENESSRLLPLTNTQSEQVIQKQQSPVKIERFFGSNRQIEEGNHKLEQICKQLQQKQNNKALMMKLQILQNQSLNQSIISNRVALSQNPHPPRSGCNNKRSAMIRKNVTIKAIPSLSEIHLNSNILTEDLVNQANQPQIQTKRIAPKKGQILRSQGSRLSNSGDDENQKSPYFKQRESRIIEQRLKFSHLNIQTHLYQSFAGQKSTQKNLFSVTPVIQVKYTPTINCKQGSNSKNKSVANSQISDVERRNCRSYTKFNGKKKYQIIGIIKNENESSQIYTSGFDQDLDRNYKRQGGSIIVGKTAVLSKNQENSFDLNNHKDHYVNRVIPNGASKEKNFLDFLKEQNENHVQKNQNQNPLIHTSQASQLRCPLQQQVFYQNKKQSLDFFDCDRQIKSRLTLEDLDIKTKEMFRKNQKELRISNIKITQENRKLKEERKMLEQEIQQKKGLSHEQFGLLINQISQMKFKIEQSAKKKQESEYRCSQMAKKFITLEEENAKLKKYIKQQKAKYDYYFKMSNINDDKEKQKQRENTGPLQNFFTSKKTTGKIHSETLSQGQVSKILAQNDRSMTSISNFNKQDEIKMINQGKKSLKKVDFHLERKQDLFDGNSMKKIQQNGQEILKPLTSSTAVSKMKMHIKPSIPKSQMNGLMSQIQSPANSVGSGSLRGLVSGLTGTGQTIVEGQKSTNLFSRN